MSVGLGLGASFYRANNENAKSAHQTVSGFWSLKTNGWEAEILMERYSRDPTPWYQKAMCSGVYLTAFLLGCLPRKIAGGDPA